MGGGELRTMGGEFRGEELRGDECGDELRGELRGEEEEEEGEKGEEIKEEEGVRVMERTAETPEGGCI